MTPALLTVGFIAIVLVFAFVRQVSSKAPATIPEQIPGEPMSVTVDGRTVEISPRVQALIRRREKIQAIKDVRTATGLGLKEARDVVEAAERQMG